MKALLGIIGALLLAGGAFQVLGGGSDTADAASVEASATAQVRRGELQIAVTEDGYLKAKNSVNLQPKFAREGTITWLVKEGKTVETDEILVEFDKTEVQSQIDDLANSLIQYKTELEAARAELEIQKRESTATVEKAEFELEVAQMKIKLHEKGEAPNELRKKKLADEKAESELARARDFYSKVPELLAQGFLTKIQEEEERIKVRECEIAVENAKKDLELYEIYTQPMTLRERQNGVKDAERNHQNAKEKSQISLKEKEVRVTSGEGKVKSTETRLAKLEKDLGHMTMKAPRAGIVHYGDPGEPWMHDEIKIGNRVRQGNTVITLPDLKEMQVLIQVHEAEIDLVKLDQTVVVTAEAVPDRSFTAKVTKIGAVANSNWGNPENKTFEVEITMDPTEVELRAGTTAKAEIQVEKIPDVVHVPIHAVFAEDGQQFAFVANGPKSDKRPLKIGKHNEHFVQVFEGLKEGERVLLYDPREGGGASSDGPGEKAPDKAEAEGAVPGASALGPEKG